MKNDIWYLDDFNSYQGLCPVMLEGHDKKTSLKVYRKNEFLFMEKDLCKDIMLIANGKVKVGQYDERGNEHIIAFLGKGEILGQIALLGETCHRNFAEVMEEGTQVCKMSIGRAHELTRNYVPFALEMNRHISGHIRKLERRIEILHCKNIKARFVEFLKDLAEDHGRSWNGGIWISHTLTQSDIAAIIGTSRKSASLIMNELENDGLIEFDRKHIYIHNQQELRIAVSRQGHAYA